MLPFFIYLFHTNWHLDNLVHLFLFYFFLSFPVREFMRLQLQFRSIRYCDTKIHCDPSKKEQVDILTIMKSLTRHYALGTSLFP